MKILILGYTGYIGLEVYKKLIKNNFFTRGAAKKNLYNFQNHIDSKFLNKKNNLRQIVKNFDIIINCVGEVRKKKLMRKTHILDHNKIVSSIALNAKKFSKRIHWIQISTLGVYGFDGNGPITQIINDKTPTNPLSLYEKTKLVSEKILLKNSHNFFKYTILRVGTVVSKISRGTLFDKLVNLAKKNIIIFIETKKTILNVIYLEDLSNIILRCIHNSRTFGKTYNLATNLKLEDFISFFEKKSFFIFKFNISTKILKNLLLFFNIFKKKKIKTQKKNFFLYKRVVSIKPILKDLKYNIKFNLNSILKERS